MLGGKSESPFSDRWRDKLAFRLSAIVGEISSPFSENSFARSRAASVCRRAALARVLSSFPANKIGQLSLSYDVAGRVTSRLNSLYSFESGYCVFEGYLFDFLAAFYVEIDIGVVIANIHFVDQVVNEAASEF